MGEHGVRATRGKWKEKVRDIHAEIRKILPPGQRSIVKLEDVKLDRLVDIITPEELHALNVAMEKKLLAQPAEPLQERQRAEKI